MFFTKTIVLILDKCMIFLFFQDRRLKKRICPIQKAIYDYFRETFSIFNWYFGILHSIFYLKVYFISDRL